MQTRKFKIVWLKLPSLGEVEIAVRLGVKSWFADVGLSRSDSTLGLFFFFFFEPVLCERIVSVKIA